MHTSGIVVGGNYVVGAQIGEGGMGVVYEATQWSLGRKVVVKLPRADLCSYAFVFERFRTEALAGSRLRHANLVAVIDYGEHRGLPFLVTEYVDGRLLGALGGGDQLLDLATIIDLGEQVLGALGEAHAAGVVHGDVKCDNILVETLRTGALRARLIDFGLACIADEPALTGAGRILSGTPEYLAPEVIRGEPPTIATDIYAVGVMLYQLLTGTTPFSGGSVGDILGRQATEHAVPPSRRVSDREIPAVLETVVMRALAKDPANRYPDADACAAALRAARPSETTTIVPMRPFELALVETSETIMAAYRDLVQSGLLQAYEQASRAPTVALARP